MSDLLEKLVSGAVTLLLLGWVWNRFQRRHDKLEDRVALIERHGVTREELAQALAESALSRREMHQENQGLMKAVRADIATNEGRRSKTEHDILDVVNALNLKIAAAEAVEKYRNRQIEG